MMNFGVTMGFLCPKARGAWSFIFLMLFSPLVHSNGEQLATHIAYAEEQVFRSPQQVIQQLNESVIPHYAQLNTPTQLRVDLILGEAHSLMEIPEVLMTISQRGLRLSQQLSSRLSEIKFMVFLAQAYRIENQYIEAQALLEKALLIAQSENDLSLQARVMKHLAVVAVQNYQNKKAYSLIQRSKEIAQSVVENDWLLADIEQTLAYIYHRDEKFDQARQRYTEWLTKYQSPQFQFIRLNTLYALGTLAREAKQWQQGEHYFAEYLAIIDSVDDGHQGFFAHYGLTKIFYAQQQCDRVLQQAERAKHTGKGARDYYYEIDKMMAFCFAVKGDYSRAWKTIENVDNAFFEDETLAGSEWHLEVIKIKSDIANREGRWKQSIGYLNRYIVELNALRELENRLQISQHQNELQLMNKTLKKQVELLENRARQLEAQHQIQATEIKQGYLILAISTGMLLSYAFWLQYRSRRKFKNLSMTDELTELYNRRFIFDVGNKLLNKRNRGQETVSVIVFDIDDFKLINDTYGHTMGDYVLKLVADLCSQFLRNGEYLGRVGGEEFMVLLPRASIDQAADIAERIRKGLQEAKFAKLSSTISVTASFGVAECTDSDGDMNGLYTKADNAMYHAKEAGKNRVRKHRP